MSKQLAALVLARRQELKTGWEQRLRVAPPSTPLALPEILFHRMEDTLDQLDSLLGQPYGRRWLDENPPQLARLREQCRCGLSPLLDYFATGAAALEAVLQDLDETDKTRLDQAWHVLAQREIESLCAVCRRVCAPALQFPS